MSKVFRVSTSIALVVAVLPNLFANPVGTWQGHVEIDASKIPAAQRAQAAAGIKEAEAMRFVLQIKSGGKYSSKISSMGHSVTSEGKWTATASTVTLQVATQNGKPVKATGFPPQVFKLSANGKVMTANQQMATIIFKKS